MCSYVYTDKLAVYWWFEDALKRRFAEFVASLETATHDSLVHVRSKVVRVTRTHTHTHTDTHTHRQTHRHTGTQTHRHTDRQTEKQ